MPAKKQEPRTKVKAEEPVVTEAAPKLEKLLEEVRPRALKAEIVKAVKQSLAEETEGYPKLSRE